MQTDLMVSLDRYCIILQVGSGILQWFSSNPTPAFKSFTKAHRDIILTHCGRDVTSNDPWETSIDLTIQIRNFKDLGVYEQMSCYKVDESLLGVCLFTHLNLYHLGVHVTSGRDGS